MNGQSMMNRIKEHKGLLFLCAVWISVSLLISYAIITNPAEPQEFNTEFNQIINVDGINYTFTTKCYFMTYEGEFCASEEFYITSVAASVEPISGGQKYNYTQEITIPDYYGEGTVIILVDIDFADENRITISFGHADFKFNQEGNNYTFISDINFNTEETTVPVPSTNYSIESNPLKVNSHQIFDDYKNKKLDQGLNLLYFSFGLLGSFLVAYMFKSRKVS